jgi:hypothetical protein
MMNVQGGALAHKKAGGRKMLIFDTSTIYDDIINWEQSPEELAAWTEEAMGNELFGILGDDGTIHDSGEEITLKKLARLYTETAHEIAEELKAE